MAQRNEHLIVIMLEKIPAGQEFEVWPPHITIVPWFPCDDFERLDETLSSVALKHQKLIVYAGQKETWGRNKDGFRIALIDDPGGLHRLHWDILHSLEKAGFPVHQKEHLGKKYKPHVALRNRLQKDWDYKPGQEIQIDQFTLVSQVRLKKSGRMIKSVRKEYLLS